MLAAGAIYIVVMFTVDGIETGLELQHLRREVTALKGELDQTTAQRQLVEWIAAFGSATSISFVMDNKPDAVSSSHIVGMLWPRHLKPGDQKTNPWDIVSDLMAYNWFSGSKKQHLVLPRSSVSRKRTCRTSRSCSR